MDLEPEVKSERKPTEVTEECSTAPFIFGKAAVTQSQVSHQDFKAQTLTFSTLPVDIVFELFKTIDPVSSTCLGLTCKSFYTIHKSLHSKVGLSFWLLYPRYPPRPWVCDLLSDWMPPDLVYNKWADKYTTPEEVERLTAFLKAWPPPREHIPPTDEELRLLELARLNI